MKYAVYVCPAIYCGFMSRERAVCPYHNQYTILTFLTREQLKEPKFVEFKRPVYFAKTGGLYESKKRPKSTAKELRRYLGG